MRSNTRTYLAVILSAVVVAAVPASPTSARYHYYGAYGAYRYHGSCGPYSPTIRTPRYGKNPDFQDGDR